MSWPTSAANRGRPLHGIRVLDLTRVLAGPFCAMLLADLGADVIKVEAPVGDETRRWGPPFFEGTAAYYFGANRNKWGIVLDFAVDEDRALLRDLISQADVVLQNFTGETARRFGVDYETVAALNPDAIHLSLWAYGPEAPETRGYDLILQAVSGMMAATGEANGPPVKVGVPISDLSAALYSALSVVSQLFARQNTRRGARIDISLYDSVLSLLANQSMNWLLCDVDTHRWGSDHPVITPYGRYGAADGDVIIAVGSDQQFAQLCQAIDAPDLALDSRFASNAARVAHREELRAAIETITSTRPARDVQQALDQLRVPNAMVRTVGQALDSAATKTVTPMTVNGREAHLVMNPIRIDGQYLQPYLFPPELGEHTTHIR